MRLPVRPPWKPMVCLALAWAAAISTFTIHELPSRAMERGFQRGDRLLVNRLAYGVQPPLFTRYVVALRDPQRGDVVLVDDPAGGRSLKRVVALPGETVSLADGRLVIDGVPVDDPWLTREPGDEVVDFPATPVPEGRFFVMGDRRGRSRDSRDFGAVPFEGIVGRASWTLSRGPG